MYERWFKKVFFILLLSYQGFKRRAIIEVNQIINVSIHVHFLQERTVHINIF